MLGTEDELGSKIVAELLQRRGSALTHFTVSSFALPSERHDTVSSFCRRSIAPSAALVSSVLDSALAALQSPTLSVAPAPVSGLNPSLPAYVTPPRVVRVGGVPHLRIVARVLAEAAMVVVTLYIALLGGRQIVRATEVVRPLVPGAISAAETRVSNDTTALSNDIASARGRLMVSPSLSVISEQS